MRLAGTSQGSTVDFLQDCLSIFLSLLWEGQLFEAIAIFSLTEFVLKEAHCSAFYNVSFK